ncbi:MAG: ABC transporter permease subunit [Clostridia bacterium]|nr:ABC transporter permease subunit [Clostridia bacterium]
MKDRLIKISKKLLIVAIWLAIWQAVSAIVNNNFLLAGPYESVVALIDLVKEVVFWRSVLNTTIRVLLGLISGIVIGVLLAYISYKVKIIEEFFTPFMTVLKSIPVVSFIIIVIIWIGNKWMSIIVVFLVLLPIIYSNMLNGFKGISKDMLELSKVYKMTFKNKTKYIYMPALSGYIYSALEISIGMAWKSGVAAETVGQPIQTIGDQIYLSKVYLASPDLFAWTFVTILLSFICEKLILLCLHQYKPKDIRKVGNGAIGKDGYLK